MSNELDVSGPGGGAPTPRSSSVLQVVNGALVALGALYLATASVAVVLVGAVVIIAVVALYVFARRL